MKLILIFIFPFYAIESKQITSAEDKVLDLMDVSVNSDLSKVGHVGIWDYGGAWLNAGYKTVNKFPHLTPPSGDYQPARMRNKN